MGDSNMRHTFHHWISTIGGSIKSSVKSSNFKSDLPGKKDVLRWTDQDGVFKIGNNEALMRTSFNFCTAQLLNLCM